MSIPKNRKVNGFYIEAFRLPICDHYVSESSFQIAETITKLIHPEDDNDAIRINISEHFKFTSVFRNPESRFIVASTEATACKHILQAMIDRVRTLYIIMPNTGKRNVGDDYLRTMKRITDGTESALAGMDIIGITNSVSLTEIHETDEKVINYI